MQLEDGRTFAADVLVGADGIWSKIRKQLIGETKANYSGYTCYTGEIIDLQVGRRERGERNGRKQRGRGARRGGDCGS